MIPQVASLILEAGRFPFLENPQKADSCGVLQVPRAESIQVALVLVSPYPHVDNTHYSFVNQATRSGVLP